MMFPGIISKAATLIHIPHAGIIVPSLAGFVVDRYRIDREIKLLTDWHTDRIFDVAGIDRLICPWSRVFCDVERLLEGEKMEAVGMGMFYTHCDDGTLLREDRDGARDVVLGFYRAHHQALEQAVAVKLKAHGHCLLIDAHSFTDLPLKRDLDKSPHRPDICIGTTQENTPEQVVDHFQQMFQQHDLSVEINRPYSGSMVPRKFIGDPKFISIMVEINRAIYIRNFTGILRLNSIITKAINGLGVA